jgi:hypothetical protein
MEELHMTKVQIKTATKTESTYELGDWCLKTVQEGESFNAKLLHGKEAPPLLDSYSPEHLWQLSEVLQLACRDAGYKPPGTR